MLPSPAALDILEKSAETMNWLRENIKIGFTSERGPAWWAAGAVTKDGTWDTIPDGSHFSGPVPMEEVHKLLDLPLVKATATFAEYLDENGVRQVTKDTNVLPIINARTGQVFSYPREGYKIHPYLETLSGFIGKILDDDAVAVGSVGLLKKGGVAFLQAVLPEHYEVAGYGFVPYVSAVTSADLSRSTSWNTGIKGMVCDNTVNMALKEALTMLKVRHTRNSGVTVQHARERLGIQLTQVADETADAIEALVKIDVSDKQLAAWMDLAVPLVNEDGTPKVKNGLTIAEGKREKLTALTRDPKVAPWNGTAFGVLQMDNTFRTWEQTVRSATGGRLERNFANDALGVTAKADAEAMEILAKVLDRQLVLA
jgi:phage/plasmid-like protein (TIGR03299 family)